MRPDKWNFVMLAEDGEKSHRCQHPGCDFPATWRVVSDEEREQHWRAHQRVPLDDHPEERDLERERLDRQAADRRERRHRSLIWRAAHQPRECKNPYCPKIFTPRRVDTVYHSPACQKADARRRKREDA
jgi:hypothetical protein